MDRTLAIYPTAHKVEDILRRASPSVCEWDYRVVTFPQLIRRLWRECRDGRAAIEAGGERLIVEEAMRASAGNGLAPVPGLVDHIHGLIRQFKSAALNPGDLTEASARLKNRGRLDAVVTIFAAYENILERNRLADTHDREDAVLRMLHAAEGRDARPALLDGVTRLMVAEIYDFSILQFMIVTALTRIIGDAIVTIQASARGIDATRFADLTWNRFVAEESIADQVLPDFVRRDGRPGALGFVLEHLFSEPLAEPPPHDATLAIVQAPSRLGEVEYAARAIRRQLEADDGIPPARIAVVARDLAPYTDHLRAVFRRYRIPLSVFHSGPLMAAPAARLLAGLVRAPLDGYPRAALAALLRSPHLDLRSYPAARLLDELGYIDAGALPLADCLDARRQALTSALDAAASAEERERLESAHRRLDRAAPALERLMAALAPLAEPGTLAEHLARLEAALVALGFDPARGEYLDDAGRSWNALRAILDESAALAARGIGAGALTTLDFAAVLEAALTAAPAPEADGDPGGVRAMPVLDARGLDFDLVFVVGLDDGTFPTYHGEDPILTDAVIRAMNPALRDALRKRFGARAPSALGKILRSRSDRNAEDAFLFFLALSMPARRAVLTFPAAETNPLVRSPFVDEVLRVLGGADDLVTTIPAESLIPLADDCYAREEFLARAALDRLLDGPAAEQVIDRGARDSIITRSRVERDREAWLAMPVRQDFAREQYRPDQGKFATAGPFDGRVTPPEGLRRMLLADRPGWSASRLDELAACGFKFFAGRILRLRDDDEPDYELSALESGSLVHEVLRRMVGEIDPGAGASAFKALLERIRVEQRAMARDLGFFDLEWETVERIVERAHEFDLQVRGTSPGVEIRSEHDFSFVLHGQPGGSDLTLRGRIDRLELYRRAGRIEAIRVLDYKRARSAKTYAKLADPKGLEFGRIAFQLPIYLMGALQEFRAQLGPDPKLEAGYLVLRSRRFENVHEIPAKLIDPDLAARAHTVDSVPDRIVALAGDAIAGRFDVDPRKCDDWCPYRPVCRYHQRRGA
ncbi:MAG TPA: PD-(D/E)XK nuclease family protein [Candidatus Binataceae bacterium]|nr:PD-(D/E)XK nuclease family protein [Candidatus Binataceae bacterium]